MVEEIADSGPPIEMFKRNEICMNVSGLGNANCVEFPGGVLWYSLCW